MRVYNKASRQMEKSDYEAIITILEKYNPENSYDKNDPLLRAIHEHDDGTVQSCVSEEFHPEDQPQAESPQRLPIEINDD